MPVSHRIVLFIWRGRCRHGQSLVWLNAFTTFLSRHSLAGRHLSARRYTCHTSRLVTSLLLLPVAGMLKAMD